MDVVHLMVWLLSMKVQDELFEQLILVKNIQLNENQVELYAKKTKKKETLRIM